jgi:hypothetical protein
MIQSILPGILILKIETPTFSEINKTTVDTEAYEWEEGFAMLSEWQAVPLLLPREGGGDEFLFQFQIWTSPPSPLSFEGEGETFVR